MLKAAVCPCLKQIQNTTGKQLYGPGTCDIAYLSEKAPTGQLLCYAWVTTGRYTSSTLHKSVFALIQ